LGDRVCYSSPMTYANSDPRPMAVLDAAGMAARLLRKYEHTDAVNHALDYRLLYDQGTDIWLFWGEVLAILDPNLAFYSPPVV
jgi:hypothetical protein